VIVSVTSTELSLLTVMSEINEGIDSIVVIIVVCASAYLKKTPVVKSTQTTRKCLTDIYK
jgi:hypothetical protein